MPRSRFRNLLIITKLCAIHALAQTPPICFVPADSLPAVETSHLPVFVCANDFDLDGNKDLATLNYGSHNCKIYMGAGDGTFSHVFTYTDCNFPRSIVSSDFNSDGYPDLAICNYPRIDVLAGAGNGTFVFTYSFTSGNFPFAMHGTDLNLDGRTDLAIVDTELRNLHVFLGNGAGMFIPVAVFPSDSIPYQIASGDFDGNGIIDLAVVNFGDPFATIFYGSGDGNFTHDTFSVGNLYFSIAAADFNHDGFSDVAIAGFGWINVYLSSGTGSFVNAGSYLVTQNQVGLDIADFNNDGHPDIASSNHGDNTAAFLAGQGNGLFSNPVYYNIKQGPGHIIHSDFNNDGKIDAAVVNYNADKVSILLNDLPFISIAGPSMACQQQTVTLTANGAASYTWAASFTGNSLVLLPVANAVYTVTGSSFLGCINTASFALSVVNCTGLRENGDPVQPRLFPNPSYGPVVVDDSEVSEFSLLNSEGQLVAIFKNSAPADLSFLPKGLYMIQFKKENHTYHSKLILE